MSNTIRNKSIEKILFRLLLHSLLLLSLTIVITPRNQVLAEKEQEPSQSNLSSKDLQIQDIKLTRSDLQHWVSAVDDEWSVFTHPDGGISLEYPAKWVVETYSTPEGQTVYYMVPPGSMSYPDQMIQIVKYPNQNLQPLETWFEEAHTHLGVLQDILNQLPRELVVMSQGQLSLQVYGIPASSPEIHIFIAQDTYIFDVVISSPTVRFTGIQVNNLNIINVPLAPVFQFPMSSSDTNYWKFGVPASCGPLHNGVDYDVKENAEVNSVANGLVIVRRYEKTGYGYYVVIAHKLPDSGAVIYSLYAHLNSMSVSEGQTVKRNELVGTEGKTGDGANNTVHLHFELRKYEPFTANNPDKCGNYTIDLLNTRFYNPDIFIPNHAPGNIGGLVRDGTGQPVTNATVKFYSKGFNESSPSNNGLYSFQDVPRGDAIIIAEKDRKWGLVFVNIKPSSDNVAPVIVLNYNCIGTGPYVCTAPTPPDTCFSSSNIQSLSTNSCNLIPNPGCEDESADGVFFYADKNFKGSCLHTTSSVPDFGKTVIGDNNVSSVRINNINGDYKATLFEDKDKKGRSDEINHDEPNLDDRSLGGQYSSAEIEADIKCDNTDRSGVYLYQEKDYERNCLYTISDIPDLGATLIENDHLRSIRIVNESDKSYCATLYKDKNYEGASEEVCKDNKNLTDHSLGDQYSSVTVRISPINKPPNAPFPVSPSSGAVLNEMPKLCWQSGGDPNGDALEFQARLHQGSQTWISEWQAGVCWQSSITTLGQYTWEVQARDVQQAISDWSPTNAFAVNVSKPLLVFTGPASANKGEAFNVNVIAQGVPSPGLYGVQLDINYDPQLISANKLQINPDLNNPLFNDIDNSAGKIRVITSRQGHVPGLTGDVPLLTFEATGLISGTANFAFENVMGGTPDALALEMDTQSFTILIRDNLITTTATVSGQVVLKGRANDNWSGAIVTVNDSGQSGTTNSGGSFTIANVSTGQHTGITADAPGYLSAVCTTPTITAPETILISVTLLAGDVNNDEVVDITDAAAIGVSFNQTGSNLPTDINRDGVVNILDLILVRWNFGEKGGQSWDCLGTSVGLNQ